MRIIGLDKLKSKYDVIVIGAGMGGLACGAYLAKSGMKVLIVEHHSIPGGCCTSFKRGDFVHDVGVHYLGNMDENGVISTLLSDLNLINDVEFIRANPNDTIIMPDCKINFYNDFEETIQSIRRTFPDESKAIENFCRLMNHDSFIFLFRKLGKITFRQVLDEYFKSEKLKSLFCVMLGNIGLPSTQVCALTAAVMYRDYIFRGGYYPKGGIQRFPDAVAKRFMDYGGDLLLNKEVVKIKVRNQIAQGIEIEGGYFIESDFVVSNCSSKQTFLNLIGKDYLPSDLFSKLCVLKPSPSSFIIYFSLKESEVNIATVEANNWYCPDYKSIDSAYEDCFNGRIATTEFLLLALPSIHDGTICPKGYHVGHLITLVPYMTNEYWIKNTSVVRLTLLYF